jgi:hypothetical protein
MMRMTLGIGRAHRIGVALVVAGALWGAAPPPAGAGAGAALADQPDVSALVGLRLDAAIEAAEARMLTDPGFRYDPVVTDPAAIPDRTRARVDGAASSCASDPYEEQPVCTITLSVVAIVPELRDMTLAQAREEAALAALSVTPDDPEAADDRRVADQKPEPDSTLQLGDSVWVGLDPAPWPGLPKLVGQSLVAALTTLDGLAAKRQDVVPRYAQTVGTVPDEVPVDAERAFVATQPEDCVPRFPVCQLELAVQAKVPYLVGRSVAEAEEELRAAGLALAPGVDRTDARRAVEDQSMGPGELAPFGAVVGITLAAPSGRWPGLPPLAGRTLEQALQALDTLAAERARIVAAYAQQVITEPAEVPVGGDRAVVAIQPDDCPGFATDCSITLDVRAVVPDLQGGSLAEARTSLAEAGLTLAEPAAGTDPDAEVTEQDPRPGRPARFGSQVSVQVAATTPATTPTKPPVDGDGQSWLVPAALVLALVLAGGIGTSAGMRRHGRRWVGQHVRVTGDPGDTREDTRDEPGAGPSHHVSITTESRPPFEQLEEVDRP